MFRSRRQGVERVAPIREASRAFDQQPSLEEINMVNLSGLAGTVGSAENAASGAVNGLNANSSAADLTRASFLMNQYQIVATAVSAIIKADSEAKSAPARSISR
jgi:hypothetical protein